MNSKLNHNGILYLFFLLTSILSACSKENSQITEPSITEEQTSVSMYSADNVNGAVQLSGLGFYGDGDVCNAAAQGATFALTLSGDLEGCLFVFIDDYECSPSGTYREKGREFFTGTYRGQSGTFWTSYRFEAKYEQCSNGSPLGAEIFGRCQHPVTEGSGTGIFTGVSGRLDFKDDIEAGNFPFRGHLRF
jgi:hypothetical protein